ncbi:MAG: NADH dehydrogenase, FAD-containing subunit [uncultured archaeon A07HB70]|nr:MAG: NADH dehydrogenase, FAD-containing subunit [uncultured archaeon A07HB70]
MNPRVLVLGAGYAGLSLARRLERLLPDAAELTVVDASADHLVQHELHRLVRYPDLVDAITVPLDETLDRATVVTARVESVDRETRTVHTDEGALDYDVCAVCLGAETAFYGLPGLGANATPLKRVRHAERIRERFLALDAGDRVTVCGAGLSGVQVAGELAALGESADVGAEVRLVEREPTVAPTFPAPFAEAVRAALDRAGVAVETGVQVTAATADEVQFAARDPLAHDLLVWTGGIRGPDAVGGERPTVRADLRLDDRTFAVGDAARVVDADGEPVPASAAAAIREASVAATNVVRVVERLRDGGGFAPRMERYRFDVPGWIVSVGDDAVARVGGAVVTGTAARAMKTTVGAGHLTAVGAVGRATDLVREELGGHG